MHLFKYLSESGPMEIDMTKDERAMDLWFTKEKLKSSEVKIMYEDGK